MATSFLTSLSEEEFKEFLKSAIKETISEDLKQLNFRVEGSKASVDKIKVPVLFSINNRIDKFFDAFTPGHYDKYMVLIEL